MSKQKYTPSPWRWEFNEGSKDINLVGGKTRYDLTVMDFVRYGMGGAQPRFNVDHGESMQLMHKASEMGEIVKGREHHARWFKNISHPDAQLISTAPELLESLEECAELLNILASKLGCQTQDASLKSDADSFGALGALDRAREAINKALGLSQP